MKVYYADEFYLTGIEPEVGETFRVDGRDEVFQAVLERVDPDRIGVGVVANGTKVYCDRVFCALADFERFGPLCSFARCYSTTRADGRNVAFRIVDEAEGGAR